MMIEDSIRELERILAAIDRLNPQWTAGLGFSVEAPEGLYKGAITSGDENSSTVDPEPAECYRINVKLLPRNNDGQIQADPRREVHICHWRSFTWGWLGGGKKKPQDVLLLEAYIEKMPAVKRAREERAREIEEETQIRNKFFLTT